MSPAACRVADDVLLEAYARLGSMHKVGAEVGLNHSTVHERLIKLGANRPVNVFTEAERDILRRDYLLYRDLGKVATLAERMDRTVQFLSRQARALGLTDAGRAKPWYGRWKYMTEEQAALLLDDFKRSRLGLDQYLASKGWSDDGFRDVLRGFFPDEWEHVIESKAPRQSAYRLGRAVEYRVRDHLRKLGWFVLRSPASKSPLDLVAVRPGTVLFIQAKRSLALGPKEWNEVYELALSAGAIPVMAGSPTGRGLVYYRLTGLKDGSKRRQPMESFDPADPGEQPGVDVRVSAL
jgi:Holliday junction resolvase